MIRAAIYDPQLLSSEGIKIMLSKNPNINEVKTLDTTQTLSEQLKAQKPNLVVFDYSMLKGGWMSKVEEAVNDFPHIDFLVISDDNDPNKVRRFINAGIKGFLTKRCSEQEIQTSIKLIQDGGKFYCQSVIEILAEKEEKATLELSDREMEIIQLVTQGHSSTVIADRLNVSIHTVNSHRKNILKKLGLKSPTELIIYAVKQGWVNL